MAQILDDAVNQYFRIHLCQGRDCATGCFDRESACNASASDLQPIDLFKIFPQSSWVNEHRVGLEMIRSTTQLALRLQRLLPLAAVMFFAPVAVMAQEANVQNSPLGATEYKLNIDTSEATLAGAKANAAPAPEPSPQFFVSAALAGRPYAKLIEHAAREAALDPALVHAVISVESAYNATARSPAGAIGLMQLMPDTAKRYGVKDPSRSLEENLKAGTQYLRDLMAMFKGRLDLVLAAYNAGENAVIKYGEKIPPYAETQAYVPAVLAKYREWRAPLPAVPVETKEPPGPKRIEYMPGTVLDMNALRAEGYR